MNGTKRMKNHLLLIALFIVILLSQACEQPAPLPEKVVFAAGDVIYLTDDMKEYTVEVLSPKNVNIRFWLRDGDAAAISPHGFVTIRKAGTIKVEVQMVAPDYREVVSTDLTIIIERSVPESKIEKIFLEPSEMEITTGGGYGVVKV
ncbi:MAG: hypothetical protein ACRC5H_10530, partial [Treponemataceae bacterium]